LPLFLNSGFLQIILLELLKIVFCENDFAKINKKFVV